MKKMKMLFLATIMCICTLGTTVLAADEKVSTTEYDFEVTPDMVENGVVTLSTAAVDNTFKGARGPIEEIH